MTPFKKKDIVTMIGREEDETEEVVRSVVDHYWKELAVAVREMKHLNVYIHELGDMRFAKSRIETFEERTKKRLQTVTEGGDEEKYLQTRLRRLAVLREMRDEQYSKRKLIDERKTAYKQDKEDLEQ